MACLPLCISFYSALHSKAENVKRCLFVKSPSDSFIIRWGFQDICDHVFDPYTKKHVWSTTDKPGGVTFDPFVVKPGDIVFVRNMKRFFATMHPYIKHPYCIVTHGERRDTCSGSDLKFLADKKIIAWFSIHPCKFGHKKFFPLPLGIKQEKRFFIEKALMNSFFSKLRTEKPKNKLLYLNFEDKKNPERKALRAFFSAEPYCTIRSTPLSFENYLEEMAEHKFALSPRGWGPDCYRTWEALYVGTIPIVRRGQAGELRFNRRSKGGSQLDRLYEDLPILVIDEWEEITEEFLHKKYDEILSKNYATEKLFLEYWYDVIKKVQSDFREKGIYPQG